MPIVWSGPDVPLGALPRGTEAGGPPGCDERLSTGAPCLEPPLEAGRQAAVRREPGSGEDGRRTEQLRRPARDVEPDQRHHAAEPDEEADERRPPTRSDGSKRNARTAMIIGTDAIRIAASDEATWTSPAAMSGNGMTISATA